MRSESSGRWSEGVHRERRRGGRAVGRRACVTAEFRAPAGGGTSPVSAWLRGLARDAHAECGGPGVGAIGLCFSGFVDEEGHPTVQARDEMIALLVKTLLPRQSGTAELRREP